MPLGDILIVTDRLGFGQSIAEPIRAVATTRVVGTDHVWTTSAHISGVIIALPLDRPDAQRSIKDLTTCLAGRAVPMIFILRTRHEATLRQANRLGATACLPETMTPALVATALFRQIAPEKTMTDLLVESSVARAAMLFTGILGSGQTGLFDIDMIDAEADPILSTLRASNKTGFGALGGDGETAPSRWPVGRDRTAAAA